MQPAVRAIRNRSTTARAVPLKRLRFWLVCLFFLIWACVIGGRLFWLQVVRHQEFVDRAQKQQSRTFEVAPRRGVLYDRNLHELAMTVQADSIYAVPTEIDDKQTAAHALAALDRPTAEGGAPCTWFLPSAEPLTARKRWIAGHLNVCGTLTVDDGALAALGKGKSLLPAGVVAVEGEFSRGDAVVVQDRQGREVARGLSAYASDDARRIAGRRTAETETILGYRGRDEMIHRDDLVVV